MTRFIEKPFSELPDKNGYYLLVEPKYKDSRDGDYYPMQYTTEGGWNTFINSKGKLYDSSAISVEDLAYKGWLKPVTVGEYRWAEAMSDLIDEIKAKIFDYADCKLTEDEEDMVDKLQTMVDHLGEAMEIAQEFKE